ncbi:hypothetical protein AB0N65_12425 [Paenarthrobacter sp. NPDC089322]|uniref:hypothetical protein n=1 Tax=Paenarthrobacter sp. NPDC089322 TaxID=3155065 RepID=UPI0034164B9A
MRYGFIGDSHLGHIIPVWKNKAALGSITQTGLHTERTYGTEPLTILNQGQVLAEFDDIKCAFSSKVELSDYDVFVVFGMHYSFTALAKTYAQYRTSSQAGKRSAYVLSDAAYTAMVDDLFQFSKAKRVIDVLNKNTDKPVYYAQQPLPLEWVLDRPEASLRFFRELADSNDLPVLQDIYEEKLQDLERSGVRVLRQPAQTKSSLGFTLSQFGHFKLDSISPDDAKPKLDYVHMNATYGELVAQEILNANTVDEDN